MTQAEQRMIREAQDTAQRFLKFVDDATSALFPGVKYNDLNENEKSEVCAFVEWLHSEVVH